MDDATTLKVVGLACLTVLEVVNLLTMKIDSAVIGLVVAAIAGICGYELGKKKTEGQ